MDIVTCDNHAIPSPAKRPLTTHDMYTSCDWLNTHKDLKGGIANANELYLEMC